MPGGSASDWTSSALAGARTAVSPLLAGPSLPPEQPVSAASVTRLAAGCSPKRRSPVGRALAPGTATSSHCRTTSGLFQPLLW